MNCVGANANAPAPFAYYREANVTRVFPLGGPVFGGTPVSIWGSGFLNSSAGFVGIQSALGVRPEDPPPACRFGDESMQLVEAVEGRVAPGAKVPAPTAVCLSPPLWQALGLAANPSDKEGTPAAEPRSVAVRLSLNGDPLALGGSEASFEYYAL